MSIDWEIDARELESYLDERHIVGDGGERGKELAVCGKLEV